MGHFSAAAVLLVTLAGVVASLPAVAQDQDTTLRVAPTDDATIRPGSKSARNYGAAPDLLVDQSSQKDFLLRFNVSGVDSATLSRATLRLWATDSSPGGGELRLVSDPAWSESTVTWDTAPSGDGGLIATMGAVTAGGWHEFDVTGSVTANGPVAFRASSVNPDGADFASKEHASLPGPELVLEQSAPPVPDTEPPTMPASLAAGPVLDTVVRLTWEPSVDDVAVTGYAVRRGGQELATLDADATAFLDDTVDAEQTYAYEVAARDAAGNVSAAAEISVTTLPTPTTESVRLTAAGDHGGTNDKGGQTLNLLASLAPDAHLALGDFSYSQIVPEQAWCDWVINGDPAAGVNGVGALPFELVGGNHEEDTRSDGFIRDFAACLPDRMGAIGDYGTEYYFDVAGLVRVVMLAAAVTVDGVYYDYSSGPHRDWLEETVIGARAAGIQWVVVGMHKVCISASTKSCEVGESVMNWLLTPGHADLVMHGHSHSVQRSHQLRCIREGTSEPGCIVDRDGDHVRGSGGVVLIGGTFGQPADPIDSLDPEIGYFSAWMDGTQELPEHEQGVWLLDINTDTLDVRWVGSTSTYVDAFTIGPPGPNAAPTANDDGGDGFWTWRDVALTTASVLDNDTDPDNDSLELAAIDTSATVGELQDHGDGTFTYTPSAGFSGTDSFSYTVTDPDGETDGATVSIDVRIPNDPPQAIDDGGVGFTTDADAPFTTASVLVNDSDPDGDDLHIVAVDAAGLAGELVDNGDGTFGYSPAPAFTGPDAFSYTISDPRGETSSATVTITVEPLVVNGAPVAGDDEGPGFATLVDQSFTTASVLDNDADPNGDPLEIAAVDTASTQGAVSSLGDGTFSYAPPPGFVGDDTFIYTVADPEGASDIATVTISVTVPPSVLSLPPTDDATIRPGSKAGINYGSAPELLVDLSSEKAFLLRFDVTGVDSRTVARATLRLHVLDSSSSGGDLYLTDPGWSEGTITWSTAPTYASSSVAPIGPVASGSWVEVDVTAAIAGDGPLALRVSSTNTNGADYASKEHPSAMSPELIIELE